MTLKQLLKQTTGDRKQRANYVKILKMKTGHEKDTGFGFVAGVTYSSKLVNEKGKLVTNPNPTHYVSVITFIDKKLHCRVSCSCSDNLFRWEWSNTNKDASEIEYCNGLAPDTTNPTHNPGLCKHLCALYMRIQPKLPPNT